MTTIERLLDQLANEAHELGALRKEMELAPSDAALRSVIAVGDRFEATRTELVSLINA